MTIQECIAWVESHMEIRYATANGAYTAGRKIQPSGCVNHSVGCAQPAIEVFYNSMNKSSAGWGVNAILGDFHQGDGRILVTLPLDARPWGCGSGSKGSWNNSRVQWEVCEPAGHTYAGGTMIAYDVAKNQTFFDRMWKMLIAWNVYLVKKFGYPIANISDHAESYKAGMGSNHADMGQWLPKHGKSMDKLRSEVEQIINNESEDEEMDQATFNKMFNTAMSNYRAELRDNDCGDWSAEARQYAIDKGIFQGGGTGPDGKPNYMWEDLLTREQCAAVLYRFAKLNGLV